MFCSSRAIFVGIILVLVRCCLSEAIFAGIIFVRRLAVCKTACAARCPPYERYHCTNYYNSFYYTISYYCKHIIVSYATIIIIIVIIIISCFSPGAAAVPAREGRAGGRVAVILVSVTKRSFYVSLGHATQKQKLHNPAPDWGFSKLNFEPVV